MTHYGTITCGDCVEALGRLQPESVDLIVADPPYNIGVDYGVGRKADRRQDYDVWCETWINLCYLALKPSGSIWVISGQEHGADIDHAIQYCGFNVRNRITWHETFGVYCHRKFARTSRPIFYATKSKKGFTFNRETVLVPSARATKYGDRRAAPGGRIMDDVWAINRVCGTFHERIPGVPTQLPEALVRRIIEVSSNPGDTVLDPFAGSGTVPAVAVKLGRVGLGVELSEDYAKIAASRLQAAADAARLPA